MPAPTTTRSRPVSTQKTVEPQKKPSERKAEGLSMNAAFLLCYTRVRDRQLEVSPLARQPGSSISTFKIGTWSSVAIFTSVHVGVNITGVLCSRHVPWE